MTTKPHQRALTVEQELNSIVRAWLRMRARAETKHVGRQRRAAADRRLGQARSALLRLRTGVLLFAADDEERARFEQNLDEIGAALDATDASIPRTLRPRHREADPSLSFPIEACQAVARRHGVNDQHVVNYLIQQAPKLPKAERAIIFSADSHRPKAEQGRQAERRLVDRLRSHRRTHTRRAAKRL